MIRLLLADDQAIIREALKVLLEQEPDFEIVGTADNGQTAIEQVEALQPDVLLSDIEMPRMNGLMATQIICERFPQTKVIVLSSHATEEYLTRALQAGAKGYLVKDTLAEDLASTIRLVQRGHSQLGPGLFEKIAARMAAMAEDQAPAPLEVPGLAIAEPEFLLLLERFDADMLPTLAQRAVDRGVAAKLLTRLGHYLEDHPTSLAALYLSGCLIDRGLDQPEAAFPYLRFGFKEGLRQHLPRPGLLLFYEAGAALQPDAAFAWLLQAGSPWLKDDGWAFLLEEAKQRFGSDSPQLSSLLMLRQIRMLSTCSQACIALGGKVKGLQSGFDRLRSAITL